MDHAPGRLVRRRTTGGRRGARTPRSVQGRSGMGFRGSGRHVKQLEPGYPEPPLGLIVELTHRCPLQCGYCSNPLALEPRRNELQTCEWQRVFDQAAELGVLQLHLTGGEPMARPDLDVLVGHATSLGSYTNLITSGMQLDERRMDGLRNAGLEHVQLSLQHVDAEEAERIGGVQGADDRARRRDRRVPDRDRAYAVSRLGPAQPRGVDAGPRTGGRSPPRPWRLPASSTPDASRSTTCRPLARRFPATRRKRSATCLTVDADDPPQAPVLGPQRRRADRGASGPVTRPGRQATPASYCATSVHFCAAVLLPNHWSIWSLDAVLPFGTSSACWLLRL